MQLGIPVTRGTVLGVFRATVPPTKKFMKELMCRKPALIGAE